MTIRLAALAVCALLAAACSPGNDAIDESGAEVVPAEIQPQALTADHVANLIAADGARHTVLVLTGPADPTGFDQVLAGIATGDPEWLALVPSIAPETDGMYAEGLQEALTTALANNATGVLTLTPEYGSYFFVCANADKQTARPLVAAVTDPRLRASRDECLQYMDADEDEIARLEGF